VVVKWRQLSGLNLVDVEQTLRGAGIFRGDDVGRFENIERVLAEVAQVANWCGNDMKNARASRLGGIDHN
jgi:hypothetical protein